MSCVIGHSEVESGIYNSFEHSDSSLNTVLWWEKYSTNVQQKVLAFCSWTFQCVMQ